MIYLCQYLYVNNLTDVDFFFFKSQVRQNCFCDFGGFFTKTVVPHQRFSDPIFLRIHPSTEQYTNIIILDVTLTNLDVVDYDGGDP